MAEPYYGEIKITAWKYAPSNWAFCDGRLLPIAQNRDLFKLLKTMYGGDGVTTFGLPNLQGAAPMHRSDTYPQGQRGGVAAHSLMYKEMPTHTHAAITAVTAVSDKADPLGVPAGLAGVSLGNVYAVQPPVPPPPLPPPTPLPMVPMAAKALSFVGGTPHNNMQPCLVLNIIVALSGIYPTPN